MKLLVTISEAGLLLDFIYRSINFENVIVGMNTDKDLDLARVCFSLVSHFSTTQKLHSRILSQIPRMKKYIFECLADKSISIGSKVECIELLQFLVSDKAFLKYCYDHDIEDYLVGMILDPSTDAHIIQVALKTFIVLHASSVFNESAITVGNSLSGHGINKIISTLEGLVTIGDIDWELIKVIVQTLFMVSFDNKILEELKYTQVVRVIEKTIDRALEANQNRVILE